MTAILIANADAAEAGNLVQLLRDVGVVNPVFRFEESRSVLAYLKGEGHFRDRRQFPFPSVLMLDLKLSGLSGFDLLQRIREDASLKPVSVVLWLEQQCTREIARGYELGAASFLFKPARRDDVANFARSFADQLTGSVPSPARSERQLAHP
jgi:DNA-binding response OmpR family regulator